MTPSRPAGLILRPAVGPTAWFSKLLLALIIGGAVLLLVGETMTRPAIADGVDRFEVHLQAGEEHVSHNHPVLGQALGGVEHFRCLGGGIIAHMEASPIARYDSAARMVLQFAHEESARLGHTCIGSGHLLLGLLRETRGVAGKVLRDYMGLTLEDARVAVQQVTECPESPVPFSGLTQRVRDVTHRYAPEEATLLGHDSVGTEHLLLALLRDDGESAGAALKLLGVTDLAAIRKGVLQELG